MTQQYDNTNSGVLFKNDRKEKSNHPDYKGQINIDGVEFWLSAWIKEGAKGKFMSLAVTLKEEQRPSAAPSRSAPKPPLRPSRHDDDFDDAPF